jgi:hypothetical protein
MHEQARDAPLAKLPGIPVSVLKGLALPVITAGRLFLRSKCKLRISCASRKPLLASSLAIRTYPRDSGPWLICFLNSLSDPLYTESINATRDAQR